MTIDEIIKLAREAGGYDEFTSPPTDWNKGDFVISPEQLSKFATLVRNEALKALKDIRSLSSIDSAMNPSPLALTVLLADIHHIADTALANENSNDNQD